MLKWTWLSWMAVGLALVATTAALPPPERSYKILMLLPTSSISHRNVFMPLATALTERGHKITMLSNHPPHDKNPSIKYITHGLTHFDESELDPFGMAKTPEKMFAFFEEVFPKIARDLYKVPSVKEIYDKRKDFDVIIIDQMFNEATYPFAHEMPFMTISTGALDITLSAIMGNVQNPAYVPSMMEDFPRPFTFINRLKNIFMTITVPMTWRKSIEAPTQKEISKQFPDLPSLREIERNQSLNLINSHFSIGSVLPLLPNQVEIGGMHLRPGKPLPTELSTFLAGKTSVIYFSLGSFAKSSSMNPEHKRILLSAFAKLPYKVLWKYEEKFQNLPKNILVQKWMPQQDVLAHPNVKVFITHCGLLGSQEALYHGKPMLGLPIFGDQPKNAKALENKGFGRRILWKDLSQELLIEILTDLVENPSYGKAVSQASKIFRDQLETPTERAVYWTEYVIRHKGAKHLRSPERDLSWIELLHVDILIISHLVLYLVYKLIKKIMDLYLGSKKTKRIKINKRD